MEVRRFVVAALLAGVVTGGLAGCGGAGPTDLTPWAEGRSSMTGGSPADPPRLPWTGEPTQLSLLTDVRAGLALPSAWRIRVAGEVLDDNGSHPVDQTAWLLLTQPYDQQPSSDNDLNVLDLGIRTDASALDGYAGALWLGTSTAVTADLGLPTSGPGPGDLATMTREGDTVTAELIEGLLPVEGINRYGVPGGGTGRVVTGSVELTFSADGETIAGTIDLGGASGAGAPFAATQYRATFSGIRFTGES